MGRSGGRSGAHLRGRRRLVFDARGARVGHFGGAAVQLGSKRALAHARHLSLLWCVPSRKTSRRGTGHDLAGLLPCERVGVAGLEGVTTLQSR